MDYAENVLPSVMPQIPGQLHFVSGLKCDLFGIVCSNLQKSFVYILPEGKWPGKKTAVTAVPML